ncbi:MAG: KpsF/GutQ family sugar-phosphate isomerase [bacterium]
MNAKDTARRVFEEEARALGKIAARLDENFERAVERIYSTPGRVVLTGLGKTGIVARKISATLASTGTPAFFMHPADALHGDLGMVTAQDVMLAVSNSGNTEEILKLIPYLKRFSIGLIAMTGNLDSELARHAEIVLDVHVDEEVCPLNLAPTTSTTAAVVMGDALAVALLKKRDLKIEDFALFHPGGMLGKRLLYKVEDLMHTGDANPVISCEKLLGEVVEFMSAKRLGAASLVDSDGKLAGILTDGDLRRLWQAQRATPATPVKGVMIRNPKSIAPNSLAFKALDLMEQHNITVLPVLTPDNRPVGMIHLHDLIKAGLG